VTAQSPALSSDSAARDPDDGAASRAVRSAWRDPARAILVAGVMATLLIASFGTQDLGWLNPIWPSVQMLIAAIGAVLISWRGAREAAPGPDRDVRRNALIGISAWLGLQLTWLLEAVGPALRLDFVVLAMLCVLLFVIGRWWIQVLHGRFSPIETAAVYLDSIAVALAVTACAVLFRGAGAVVETDREILAFAVVMGATVGGAAVLNLAITPVRGPNGWMALMLGMAIVGGGLMWRIGTDSSQWHPADLVASIGVLLGGYGAATWTNSVDPSDRFRLWARGLRNALPVAAVALAAVLLIVNEVLLPVNGEGVGLAVDVALALVLADCVVRQTLMVRERSRLLRQANDAVERERLASTDLAASEQRFRTLVQNSSDVFLILKPDGTVDYQSPAVERVLGYAPGDRLGRQIFELTHPEDLGFVRAVIAELMQTAGAVRTIELRSRHADGSWRTLEATGHNMIGDPMVNGIVVNYRDVTERKVLERQLIHEAFHDPLTGLANRALFIDRVDHALTRRDGPKRLAVLFMDVDDFKTINDSLGHAAGDLVLVAVAERLRGCLRPEDTVARLGGDEFGVLVEDADDSLPHELATRLLDALRNPFDISGKQVHLQASVGLAFGNDEIRTANELLRNADVAMYTAKNRGKGRVERFETSMHAAVLSRLELKADLERAITHDEFRLRYQPTFDLHDGRLSGFEALLRWRHPTRGEIFPNDFIGLAEETGLIVPIGTWVLEQACAQARAWVDAGCDDLVLSVNLSARQLREPDIVAWVRNALAKADLAPARLMLELTESSLMQDDEGRLHAIRALGVTLALDDFGTGYSSLSYLSRFPIDVLKIDRSFTSELGEVEDSALVRSVIQLASAMDMRTVAEGIERPEQLARVTALGCDFAQGYLLGRPMDPIRATGLATTHATIETAQAADEVAS
jgi:diguanylate cyclase (GGDEF)-like protein/PAS domain S-box-containing protein